MSKNKRIYKIHLLKFKHYNPSGKTTYKKTMISNNFLTDSKLSVLPMSSRWLFLGLILECGSHGRDTLEIGERQLRVMLESNRNIVGALDSLQSLQLVTYDVLAPNIREEKRKEEKKKAKPKTAKPISTQKDPTQIVLPLDENIAPEKPSSKKIKPDESDQKFRLESLQHAETIIPEHVLNLWVLKYQNNLPFIKQNFSNAYEWALSGTEEQSVRTQLGWQRFFGNWLSKEWKDFQEKQNLKNRGKSDKIPEFHL